MQVTKNSYGTFDVTGLTGDQAAMLGALADFPLWAAQPEKIGKFCEALHHAISAALLTANLGADWPLADTHGMTNNTTV
jgi:hypothetical protein